MVGRCLAQLAYQIGSGAEKPAPDVMYGVYVRICMYKCMYVCQWFVAFSWQATVDHTAAAFSAPDQNQFGMRVVPDPFPPRAGDVIHPVLQLVRGRFTRSD